MIFSPLKRTWPFIWTIQNSLYPRMICTKFDWNWPAGSGERFFAINTWNTVFPIVAPSDPRGLWCEQFWIYIISESFHVNMTYSGLIVLENNIFKWPHPILAFLWLSPLWREPDPLFELFRILFTQRWFVQSLIEIGRLVLEKIFKNVQYIFTLLLLSPLGRKQSPSFVQSRSPPLKMICAKFC
jgi:hypothetical protein